MNYPLISEYIEAIKSAEDNFEELTNLRAVLGDDGQPVMTSGNFAVVFKMKDAETGRFYALKCFTKEQEGRAEAYRQIADALKDVDSPYLVSLCYLDKELFVDTEQTSETEFPVLLMDWVEGQTLDKYLLEKIDEYRNAYEVFQYPLGQLVNIYSILEMLVSRFCELAQWLLSQPFAHGDLKPENIIVRRDGTLVLVDYDGMYIPTMSGQKARELGSPDFRHPQRTLNEFNDNIDNFPIASILLSLKAISINPQLIEEFGAPGRLLFSELDYIDLAESRLMHHITHISFCDGVEQLLTLFYFTHSYLNIKPTFIKDYNYKKVNLPNPTTVTKEDLNNSFKDSYSAMYSKDRKRLLVGAYGLGTYKICPKTEIICNNAFFFGKECWNDINVVISENVKEIGRNPFTLCSRVENRSANFVEKDGILYSGDMKHVISYFGLRPNVAVQDGVTHIDDHAFWGQSFIRTIKLPSSLESIGDYAFYNCSINSIDIPDSVCHIGNGAFRECPLYEVKVPKGLIRIGDLAFAGCLFKHFEIPSKVISIGINPFFSYHGHGQTIKVNSESCMYEDDGNAIFSKGKRYLISYNSDNYKYEIPKSVSRIGTMAFSSYYLRKLIIPENVVYVGKNAFIGCTYNDEWGKHTEFVVPKGKKDWLKNYIVDNIFTHNIIEE